MGQLPVTPAQQERAVDSSTVRDEGAREVFDGAYTKMAGWLLRRFEERLGRRGDGAADLSQRTWSAVWGAVRSGKYDPTRAAITTFVYAVAENIWRQHAKRYRPAVWLDEDDETIVGSEENPASAAATAEVLEQVRTCLHGQSLESGLTPEDVAVLQLLSRDVGDRELARQLGVAPSTANARKRAALEKLRRHLAKKWAESERSTERGGAGGESPDGVRDES